MAHSLPGSVELIGIKWHNLLNHLASVYPVNSSVLPFIFEVRFYRRGGGMIGLTGENLARNTLALYTKIELGVSQVGDVGFHVFI